MAEIAREHNVSKSAISKLLIKEGWRYRGRGAYHKKTPLIADRLYRKMDKDITQISKILNVKEPRIRDWLGKEKIKRTIKNPSVPNSMPSAGFYKRHKRGEVWTTEQYLHVVGLIKQLRTPWNIWQEAGASRQRQRLAWKFIMNTSETPPHFIAQYEKRRRKFGKQIGEKIKTPEQEIAALYQELQASDEEIEALRQEIKRLNVIIDRKPSGITKVKQKALPPEGRPELYEAPDIKELPPGQEE